MSSEYISEKILYLKMYLMKFMLQQWNGSMWFLYKNDYLGMHNVCKKKKYLSD